MSSPFQKTALLATMIGVLALGGCANSPSSTGSISAPSDYRDRHPIVIDTAPKSISIYPIRGPGGLDRRQTADIKEMVKLYRERGTGHIRILMPSGGGKLQAQTASFARKALAQNGIPSSHLKTGHYEPVNPGEASPVKIEMDVVAAKVASQCGKWDADILGVADPAGNFENRPYGNFGCSYQSALAAQVADPTDLARPRAEGDIQVSKRIDDITQVGNSEDPSTEWGIRYDSAGQ
jgi:pilus assembly protein CpaD